ncbi:hypothetical protein U0033_01730 [Chitinophaga sancti]|uniref:Uncharacterized protein n=2 Tax=Chitinophaga sancti TaxID=1004 RepID=A0A1K1MYU9_9BACT|nr:hypothetical protein [Chitinophaga sancti]WQD63098.1 hypothetical protein U0033_01730 [Chitinophaga sancti]WQG91277.1 hypothetical protein SR876_07185 [Chitinophaga sancti]SFW28354.1 hypothetical protein SAMN05661012_01005 [Chitinophaga sancti]
MMSGCFQALMNGNTYDRSTYTSKSDNWKTLFALLLIPTRGAPVPDEDLENRVMMEHDSLFFYEVDSNDNSFKLVKNYLPVKD